ncbi:MAG: hypothetical protein QM784_28025 [Polyangiaceae bacterium]
MKKSTQQAPKSLIAVMNALAVIEATNFNFDGLDGAPAGRIIAYNDAVADTHYSEPLTSYAVGWKNPESLDALLEDLAPSVTVGRRFEFREFLMPTSS